MTTSRDSQGLGKVEDFILDLRAGRIAYAVVSNGGLMGTGNKLLAVPWNAFKLDQNERTPLC